MRGRKMRHKIAGVENAGKEKEAQNFPFPHFPPLHFMPHFPFSAPSIYFHFRMFSGALSTPTLIYRHRYYRTK